MPRRPRVLEIELISWFWYSSEWSIEHYCQLCMRMQYKGGIFICIIKKGGMDDVRYHHQQPPTRVFIKKIFAYVVGQAMQCFPMTWVQLFSAQALVMHQKTTKNVCTICAASNGMWPRVDGWIGIVKWSPLIKSRDKKKRRVSHKNSSFIWVDIKDYAKNVLKTGCFLH